MIENIIFDFGGVFINLDAEAVPRGLRNFGVDFPQPELIALSQQYEKGVINSEAFLRGVNRCIPGSHTEDIRTIWNQMIADFPEERLEFLKDLKESGQYRMFLLSNTNALHIEQVKQTMGMASYNQFYSCFDSFYLSHEIGMRKPDREIFSFVLDENGLNPAHTLFIDDTEEHTLSASQLGIKTWHLDIKRESILELPNRMD